MTRLITAGLILAVCTAVVQARQWTDATRKFTVEADFVDFKDGKVQLKKADGSTITVPVRDFLTRTRSSCGKLQPADRRWQWFNRKRTSRSSLRKLAASMMRRRSATKKGNSTRRSNC